MQMQNFDAQILSGLYRAVLDGVCAISLLQQQTKGCCYEPLMGNFLQKLHTTYFLSKHFDPFLHLSANLT